MHYELLTERQAAGFVNLSLSMMRKMRGNGTGPAFVKIGASVRYPADSLAAFIQERTKMTTRKAA
jgi:predicted DNA-binding transcriptional regulator AlpA